MLESQLASIVWTIPNFRRVSQKTTSPVFGPKDCQWELTLYPVSSNSGRPSHIGLFLDCAVNAAELSNISRPIDSFMLQICKRNSNEPLIIKERTPRNTDGFGVGYSHPKSWGWASMLPVESLEDILGVEDTVTIVGQVVWHGQCKLMELVRASTSPIPRQTSIFMSQWCSDVQFVFQSCINGGESSDNQAESNSRHIIHAHKAVLASASDYFYAMFHSNCLEGHDSPASSASVVEITNFSANAIHEMLNFIYNSALSEKSESFEARVELLHLADCYMLHGLHAHIGTLMMQNDITDENCLEILELSHQYSSTSKIFKHACLEYCIDCIGQLKKTRQLNQWIMTTACRELIAEIVVRI